MQIFYAPGISGNTYLLDEKESKHCIRVLRLTKGTQVNLVDGKGSLYEGFISDPDPKKCMITVTEINRDFEKRDYWLHLAISPLKNHERLEWFVEKSVEIGVDEITPIICENTEKQSIRQDRINNIIVSAMKQSIKTVKTVLNEPIFFNEFMSHQKEGKLMIAHCKSSLPRVKISEVYMKKENAVIMIGPEGDFSDDEISKAVNNSFIPVHMGKSRLRTETAGVAACHSVYFINQ